jgi:hypothetical protein
MAPATEPTDWFLFSDMKLTLKTHIYFMCEKIIMIILSWIIAAESRTYRGALQVFFWLMVVDFVDYLLSYGSIWFRLAGFPVSMNIVKCIVFGIVVSNEWIRTHSFKL